MKYRRLLLGAAAMTVAAIEIGGVSEGKSNGSEPSNEHTYKKELNSLNSATEWLNTDPLKTKDLHGKVILVNFWTYTCINWIRSLPYVRAWAEKYKHQGLVVIGVHTPEFPFEQNIDNVRQAVTSMDIHYPIAQDNDYAVWRSFKNQYWPALYFIDGEGRIQHHQFGEGGYEEAERIIQQLLIKAGAVDVSKGLVSVHAQGVEVAADWNNLRSPENYVGYGRTENFASHGGMLSDKRASYGFPSTLRLNEWALSGDWLVGRTAIVSKKSNGRIVCSFHARDLHLVMGPPSSKRSVRFRVLIDGKPPGEAHGIDIDDEGNGMATEQRLYQLIRQRIPIWDRQIEIEFFDSDVEVFAFTFG